MAFKLHIVICSTRPGRVGPSVAKWFNDYATKHGKFETSLVDLAEFNLPLYNEPNHPAKHNYVYDHTKKWAASVDSADAYVFVTPEYNYNPTPAFVNALNYVYKEWNYKPCGFVSYGGVSGGLRAVQVEKLLVTTLKMMPMVEGVSAPMVATLLDENGKFKSNELINASAETMLNELYKWTGPLKAMRQ
ncbi:MAG: NADPH-dependent oxidoreductase [Burkholderiaceae bacterium]|nr:MAG: NADPH-dependent oxidoreductase [Burkholderiaceae bacterium]